MQHSLRTKSLLIVASLSVLNFNSCSESARPVSHSKTVEVPQTEIRNQEYVGFCWAYATVALIESNYKTKTGKTIQLSPEAIGFYRMAAGLYQATRAKSINDLLPLLMPGGLEGYYVKLPSGGGDALSLIEKYGVVPESAWSFKFDSEEKSSKMMKAMQGGLWVLLRDRLYTGRDATDLTVDDIIEKVMTVPGAFPSRPPTTFDHGGVSVSSVSFLRDNLGFHTEDYAAMQIDSSESFEKMIQAMKRSLARGVGVPLAFPVNRDLLTKNRFSGQSATSTTDFAKSGAHAVLITDFVNAGKSPGAMSAEEIVAELKRPASDLDYVVVKNSWGKNAEKNERGETVSGSETGYYEIDRAYLQGSADQALTDSRLRPIFSIMVPKDIADSPFNDESVNPVVAKQ